MREAISGISALFTLPWVVSFCSYEIVKSGVRFRGHTTRLTKMGPRTLCGKLGINLAQAITNLRVNRAVGIYDTLTQTCTIFYQRN